MAFVVQVIIVDTFVNGTYLLDRLSGISGMEWWNGIVEVILENDNKINAVLRLLLLVARA